MVHLWLFVLFSALCLRAESSYCVQVQGPAVAVIERDGVVAVGNGYTCAVYNLTHPHLAELRGDFEGGGQYGHNVLGKGGCHLEWEAADGSVYTSMDGGAATMDTSSSPATAGIHIMLEQDTFYEVQDLSLSVGERSVSVRSNGGLRHGVLSKAVRRQCAFEPTSLYALFDRGVVQLKEAANFSTYGSHDYVERLYALGGAGDDLNTAGNMSISLRRNTGYTVGVVLLSHKESPYSGFQEIYAGSLPAVDQWKSDGWNNVTAIEVPVTSWTSHVKMAPNNMDFPAQGPNGDVSTAQSVPTKDLRALLTGIYGSPVGQLCTHDNGVENGVRVAQMATTIARPSYGYSNMYNFFDPDNYVSTAALLYSQDPYLQKQVRLVLERSGSFINSKGELPHHFVGVTPTFQAISGATQTGPNVFWVLSCLNYVKATGDVAWLESYMPKIRQASAFLFGMLDQSVGLLTAPGSLMIDVFIRTGFTSDTNGMVVGFMKELADAEEVLGNTTGAAALRDFSARLADRMDALLWNNETQDHYVTQLNPDGSTRDFVDYDANFIALAHGVASPERAAAAFKRLDGGRCTHGRASFVSERYYGKHDTTAGNIGDSWCSMGRIGWFDALSRKRYGDLATFDDVLLDPLVGDVNRWTWLHERYSCDGTPQQNRTAMYFEYPSVTAMMLHYIRYGVQSSLKGLTVTPFGPHQFDYHVGNVRVSYSPSLVAMTTPGDGDRVFTVDGLSPNTLFAYSTTCPLSSHAVDGTVMSDSRGTVTFVAHLVQSSSVPDCVVEVGPTGALV